MSFAYRTHVLSFISLSMISAVGCTSSQTMNPWTLRRENAQLKSALRQYQDQLAQAKTRADNLDADNEELQTQLAEVSESQRRMEDASRMARNTPRYAPSSEQTYADEAGSEIGPGTRPSSSRTSLPPPTTRSYGSAQQIAGAQVLNDGNAVRIRVTNTSLFDPGKATLKPGATKVLDQVAASVRRSYPGQLIGIEGHTDADPIRKSNWKDNHELSYQRGKAVFDYLSSRGGIPANQLYVAAYGPNNPIASNSSSGGKAQNRRVEFVVRPEEGGGRQ
jgi:flagellar motor protein MotB